MAKEFGPGVSGYLLSDERSWETVVYQSGKPVLDRELNLTQDLSEAGDQNAQRSAMPSGWLSNDFLTSSDPTAAIFTPNVTANTLEIPQGVRAHVNGWILNVKHTNISGSNELDLGAGPVAAGERRSDLVILEVWRRLISASPATDGKSAAGRIWQNGNVATSPADDLVLNFPDDILDTNVGSETAKRVQVQYRLRSITDIDLFTYPYGLDDPSVVANTVPAAAAAPNGVATAFAYANQSAAGDAGLWVAGDGNPANGMGTVDGFMYAIPLMGVFRLNSTAFNRRTNHNGGVADPGPSDRPDGLFHDIFVARDIWDMRLGVSSTGWSLLEVLQKNYNYLLDNNLHTDIVDTSPFGGGYQGASVFVGDEIGLADVNGGDGITTGTTGTGKFVGEFDAVRRTFSDRSIYETITVAIPAPGGAWAASQTVMIDPTALPVYPYAAFNWSSYAPADVVLLDIVDAWWIGASGGTKKTIQAVPWLTSIENLGSVPLVPLDLTTGAIGGLALTDETLYVDILVAYPPGVGLGRTPTDTFGAGSFFLNNPGALPVGLPVGFSAFNNQSIDDTHREVRLDYETVTLILNQEAATGIVTDQIRLPERALSVTSVTVDGGPEPVTIDASGRYLTLTGTTTSGGEDLVIQYEAIRPLPQNGEQMTIYYEARAPQAARSSLIGTALSVIPKVVGSSLTVITTGSGSQDEGYPFAHAYVQTGGIYPNAVSTYSGEQELSARADIAVADFDASTGFLTLPIYVPEVANPESLSFTRGLGDIDVEGRSYFKTVPAGYVPNAYSQNLSDAKRHKDIVPILGELAADTAFGHKGQLVLVLLLRYALFDENNAVFFDPDLNLNTTVASVFRIKGNLLDKVIV